MSMAPSRYPFSALVGQGRMIRALLLAARVVHGERGRTRDVRLLLLTDGEANVPLGRTADCRAEARRLASTLRRGGG